MAGEKISEQDLQDIVAWREFYEQKPELPIPMTLQDAWRNQQTEENQQTQKLIEYKLFLNALLLGLDDNGNWKEKFVAIIFACDIDDAKRQAKTIAEKDCGGIIGEWSNSDNTPELYASPDKRSLECCYILKWWIR